MQGEHKREGFFSKAPRLALLRALCRIVLQGMCISYKAQNFSINNLKRVNNLKRTGETDAKFVATIEAPFERFRAYSPSFSQLKLLCALCRVVLLLLLL